MLIKYFLLQANKASFILISKLNIIGFNQTVSIIGLIIIKVLLAVLLNKHNYYRIMFVGIELGSEVFRLMAFDCPKEERWHLEQCMEYFVDLANDWRQFVEKKLFRFLIKEELQAVLSSIDNELSRTNIEIEWCNGEANVLIGEEIRCQLRLHSFGIVVCGEPDLYLYLFPAKWFANEQVDWND